MSTEKKNKGTVKGMRSEFKKIAWPTKSEVINSTLVVIAALVGVSIVTKLLDMLFQFILSFTV